MKTNRQKKKAIDKSPKPIKIIIIDNPLKKTGKITKIINLPAGQTGLRLDYIAQNMPPDYNIIIDGSIIQKKEYKNIKIKPGKIITIMKPIRGKDGQEVASILVIIAAMAANVLIPGIGSVVSGAILFVGGAIVSLFDPAKTDDAASPNNYSWDSSKLNFSQGAPIGVTYGEIRNKSGQVLAASVSSDGTDQWLSYLLCAGEGILNSINNITLEENLLSNYTDYGLEIRGGQNDQTGVNITTLGEAQSAQTFTFELSTPINTYSTAITDNNQVKSLSFSFRSSAGLYAEKNSTTGTANLQGWPLVNTKFEVRVTLSIEYKLTTDSTWTVQVGTLRAKDATPVYKTFRYDGLTTGQYNIRVKISKTEAYLYYTQYNYNAEKVADVANWYELPGVTGSLQQIYVKSGAIIQTKWETCISYFDVLPIRPGLALIAIKIKATDQLSGSTPAAAWTQLRQYVYVWHTGLNPAAYHLMNANNPWWAAYDLIHCCRNIKNINTGIDELVVFGAPADNIVFDDFLECAEYAEQQQIYFNYFFNESITLAEALKIPATVGFGTIVIKGSKYGATCEKPRTPVQLFNMGNIKKDSFKITFLPIEERANVIEITYIDKDKSWEKTTMPVYANDWDDGALTQNPTRLEMTGITSQLQAYRTGKYFLRRNKYIKRAIEFIADIDSIGCEIGDVILIQHDLPTWGSGGRIIKVITATQIQLDRTVTFETGIDYFILIRHSETDTLHRYAATASDSQTETDLITLGSTAIAAIIKNDDLFTFGPENIEAKPFVVTALTRSGELERQINAQEYDARVFDETETMPEIDYSELRVIAEVINLQATYTFAIGPAGEPVLLLSASWTLPISQGEFIKSFLYYYSTDGGETYATAGQTNALSFVINNVKSVPYIIKVKTKNNLGQISAGVITAVLYPPAMPYPPNPIALGIEPSTFSTPSGTIEGYLLTTIFQQSARASFMGFRYRYILGATANWDAGTALNDCAEFNFTFFTAALPAGTQITVMVKLENYNGILSETAASVTYTTPALAINNILGTYDINPAWNVDLFNASIIDNKVKADYMINPSGHYGPAGCEFSLSMGWAGYVSLVYDITGGYSIYYQNITHSGVKTLYTGPFMSAYGDTIKYTINLNASPTIQGVISTFTIIKWAPTRTEERGWNQISSTGQTIAPAAAFNEIQEVNTWVQNNATYTATQVAVSDINGTAGAHFQGYAPDGTAAPLWVKIVYRGY